MKPWTKRLLTGCAWAPFVCLILLYCLLEEPWVLFGAHTRFMAEWDHHLTLPEVRVLSRESGGNFMDGHIRTTLLLETRAVPAVLAQVQPSPRVGNIVIKEGTPEKGRVMGKEPGSDELRITTTPDRPGVTRMVLTTLHD